MDVGERNPHPLMRRMCTDSTSMGNNKQKLKNFKNLIQKFHFLTSFPRVQKHYFKRTAAFLGSLQHYSMQHYILIIMNKIWKHSKGLRTDDLIRKLWYICAMGYYSAIWNDDIVQLATIWMELGVSCLVKSVKYKHRMILFISCI